MIPTITSRMFSFKERNPLSKKGDHGKVLIIAGSALYPGAAALCSLAALRSGCDWVTVACPEKVAWAINCLTPDVVTVKLSGKVLSRKHLATVLKLVSRHDVVAVGNGIGLERGTQSFVHALVRACGKPMVIDADALKCINLGESRNAILTPHAGEFFALMKNSRISPESHHRIPWKRVQQCLGDTVLLLKGPIDYIVSKHRMMANTMHDPSMTKAGTGDVLAGLCAGFRAQGYSAFDSACMAAYFNGLTGRLLSKKQKCPSLIASDLVRDIGEIVKRFRRKECKKRA